MKKKFAVILFIMTFLFITSNQLKTLKAGNTINMTVDKKTGDIYWSFDAIKATTGIRWQIKGYYLSYKPCTSKNFGYPLREKREMISLYTDNNNLKVVSKKPGSSPEYVKTDVRLDGKYIKKRILENKSFYKKLISNYKKGRKKLYLDTIFETYQVVNDPSIRSKVISSYNKKKSSMFGTKEGKYVYVGGHKYDYSENTGVVKRIRKNDLVNIDMIRAAELWSNAAKKQWHSTAYYNHPIEYLIESNVIVKYVDKSGNLLGKTTRSLKIDKVPVKKINIKGKTVFNPYYNFKKDKVDSRLIKNDKYAYFCDDVTISLPKEIEIKEGKKTIKYKLKQSYYKKKDKGIKKNKKTGDAAKTQKITLGLNEKVVVGQYSTVPGGEELEEEEIIKNELPAPNPRAKIAAGTLKHSDFDVEAGIPVDEYYYKLVISEEYLLKYRFKKIKKKKKFSVKGSVEIVTDKGKGKKKKNKKDKKGKSEKQKFETVVFREYSYWIIDNLELYTIESATLYNESLPDTGEKIFPNNYNSNFIKYKANKDKSAHIKLPKELKKGVNLGKIKNNGKKPLDFDKLIEKKIGKIRVKNDFLEIDGTVIMDDKESDDNTPIPKRPEELEKDIGKDTDDVVLYSFGKKIERHIANGNYESSGKVTYVMTESINPEGEKSIDVEIDYVNPVVVHTPVVCDYKIRDAKHWCQLVEPDETRYQLVLDKDFELMIMTLGKHRDIKGYGYREYAKYVQRKEVIFPFEVVYEGQLYPQYTPVIIRDVASFNLPITVKEGKYEILTRTVAINYIDGRNPFGEEYANLSIENYVAENKIPVEVSGRLIDFTLTGIKNSSIWEDAFKGEYSKGLRLDNLPMFTGDNTLYSNEGKFKRGYAVTFAMTTIGSYYNEPYGVEMDLDFSVMDEETSQTQPVDVYYEAISEETGESLGLVRLGSERDKSNIHFIEVSDKKIGLFTYGRELLPRQLLDTGSNEYIQRWRGEYALPERIYICKRGLDLKKYMNSNMALYFDEDIWIKKGTLIVSAEIFAIKDGEKRLSYINAENSKKGYFNNWEYETSRRSKFSQKGKLINFKDGDLFAYDLKKYIWQERRSELKKVY